MQRDSERIFDEYLVVSAQAGDRAAWQRLVARWQPRLLRHAWRLTGHADRAADLVQDAWIDIWKGLRRLDDAVAFPAWAFRIVTRRCHRAFQNADRERLSLTELADTVSESDDATGTEALAREIDLTRVREVMAELPSTQRAALSLFHLEDLSVAEIAIALDVPPGTVKTRLMHARRKIRARLEGDSNEQDR
ncbi:MAG: sigma-70 family RNA polymerase sigma factor [Lysobacteraceae bacterium]|nr:MAG: sigma-70 family RNA polymerase sigma factor [Xanthomonadaceae bacterium]